MPILSVFAPLLKSRFFVIYFRGITLADGIGAPLVAFSQWLCYNTHNESEGIDMHKILFVCHGKI